MKCARILNLFIDKMLELINPVNYAKRLGVNIGKNLHIYGHIKWGSEPWLITIGDECHLTDGVRFITHDGGTLILRHLVSDLEITKPIHVGNRVYIGVETIILPGVNIGNNVVIGARTVVSKDIPDNSVVVGAPAKVIKSTKDYLEKLKMESIHLGHLKGKEKEKALKNYFKYNKPD